MANSQHIEWLREGVQKWNERRKCEVFVPDLRETNIPQEFGMGGIGQDSLDRVDLSGIDLRRAKLQKAELYQVILSNANLQSADLRECDLNGTNFEGANLDYADLRGARTEGAAYFKGAGLVKANLMDAEFWGADLRNTVLSEANLCGTVLVHARLSGANLSRTELWNAVLVSGNSTTAPEKGLSEEKIKKVEDLLNICGEFREKHDKEDILLYFRGESRNTWKLRPSVMRKEGLRRAEGEMLVDLMSRRPDEFNDLNSSLANWVLAQHFELPTRLLDITQNPLVALFHACEDRNSCGRLHFFAVSRDLVKPFDSDTISIIANLAKLPYADQQLILTKRGDQGDIQSAIEFPEAMERLYHLIRQEKPHFQKKIEPKDLFRVFIVVPQRSFERVQAQSGVFLISAFHERFEPPEILKWNDGTPIYDHYALDVSDKDKEHIIEQLSLLNITRETLFPGLDEAAKAVKRRFEKATDSSRDGE